MSDADKIGVFSGHKGTLYRSPVQKKQGKPEEFIVVDDIATMRDIYTKMDRRRDAGDALADALKLNPANEHAQELLQRFAGAGVGE